jgi:hypothetical protein
MGETTMGAGASRPGTVAERLRQARRRRFMGRAGELELFRTALEAPEPPFTVFHVHGPGGVGKTALLQAFAEAAVGAGRVAVALDGRELEPSPSGFLAALGLALGVPGHDDPLAALPNDRPVVLLLDTYEMAAPLDDWLRERFLPALPGDTLVVLGGRNPPSPAWRVDAGWGDLLRVISLRNLRPEDSRAYLHAAGVPEGVHERVLGVTHGHPLALSLVVEVLAQGGTQAAFEPGRAPDLVRLLLGRFLEAIPSGRHRRALQVCAHTRVTTEGLLRAALGPGDRTRTSCSSGFGTCPSSSRVRSGCSRTSWPRTRWTPTCAGATARSTSSCTGASGCPSWSASAPPTAWSSSAPSSI